MYVLNLLCRVEKSQQRQNEAAAQNNKLKQEIDDLRKERLACDQVYSQLERDLDAKKREMGRVIESSNRAYEARDNALAEMARLKSQAEKEEQAFQSEWRELGRQVEHDRKMRDVVRARKQTHARPGSAQDTSSVASSNARRDAMTHASSSKHLLNQQNKRRHRRPPSASSMSSASRPASPSPALFEQAPLPAPASGTHTDMHRPNASHLDKVDPADDEEQDRMTDAERIKEALGPGYQADSNSHVGAFSPVYNEVLQHEEEAEDVHGDGEESSQHQKARHYQREEDHDTGLSDGIGKHTHAHGREEASDQEELEFESKLTKKSIGAGEQLATAAAPVDSGAKQAQHEQALQEEARALSDALSRIKQATGTSSVDELVESFQQAEEENASLFKQVDELSQEVNRLEEQASDMRNEISRIKELNSPSGHGASTQRSKLLSDLETRLEKAQERAAVYEERHNSAVKTVSTLRSGIARIFTKAGCDTENAQSLFGSEGVTESNMMQYLGLIEQRANELLQQHAATVAESKGLDPSSAKASVLGHGPSVPPGSAFNAISVQAPSSFAVSADELDEERDEKPLLREELLSQSGPTIAKHEEHASAAARHSGRSARDGSIDDRRTRSSSSTSYRR